MDWQLLRAQARAAMTEMAFDYLDGGADEEITLADNSAAWNRLRLRPHVLRDVSAVDAATTVLGTAVTTPVLAAPVGSQRLAHPDGECELARATTAAGTVLIASTMATTTLEDIAAAAPGARWMQIYLQRDRGAAAELVRRAAAAGYTALVLTVDLPVLGYRRRDERGGFTLPAGLTIANFGADMPAVPGASGLGAHVARDLDPALVPADIAWVADLSGLPVVVKGVLRGDDARACVDAGAAAIVVSNHGGRQLDGAIATADALPEVVAAVGEDVEVYVDGGIRAGTDVLKALALGARAVLVGRPLIWGLATDGADGARGVLDTLTCELLRAMALCGARTIAEIDRDLVVG
ncbi:MAG: alpha-hydroxy acid oxidase [Sporichthyaceae bacterium]